MKTKVLYFAFLLLTSTAWAQKGSLPAYDEEKKVYLLSSLDDWNNLADYVASGNSCSGLSFIMTQDIGTAEEPVTRPIGKQTSTKKADRKRFSGSFDGQGNTLTVNIASNSAEYPHNPAYACPFAYLSKASIKNLHVVGTVTAYGQFGSGLAGSTGNGASDGTCTLENIHVSVHLISRYTANKSAYANHGSFIGVAEGNVTMTNCWFDGTFSVVGSNDFTYSGGFVGLNKGILTMNNCLFAISDNQLAKGSYSKAFQFSNNNTGTGSHGSINENSTYYYSALFGETSQGTQVFTTIPFAQNRTVVNGPDGNTYYVPQDGFSKETVSAHEVLVGGETRYFTTFYHPTLNFRLSEGSMAMTMTDDGTLYTIGNGSVVPAACACVIMSLTPEITFTVTDKGATPLAGNVLMGTSEEAEAPAGTYVLTQVGGSLGFVLCEEGMKIPANKAYRFFDEKK